MKEKRVEIFGWGPEEIGNWSMGGILWWDMYLTTVHRFLTILGKTQLQLVGLCVRPTLNLSMLLFGIGSWFHMESFQSLLYSPTFNSEEPKLTWTHLQTQFKLTIVQCSRGKSLVLICSEKWEFSPILLLFENRVFPYCIPQPSLHNFWTNCLKREGFPYPCVHQQIINTEGY